MKSYNRISANISDPHELERLYREDPEKFKESFQEAWEHYPDSSILTVWYERLNYQETTDVKDGIYNQKDFLIMGLLALLAGMSSRIIFYFVLQEQITPINLIFGIVPFIIAYFLYRNPPRKKILYAIISMVTGSFIYLNLLTMDGSDSVILAYLHIPVFLWVLTGLAFTGNDYADGRERLSYLRFNGEFVIVYGSMAISGVILTGVTLQLFSLAGLDIAEFYFSNVVLIGATGLSVVAAYLVYRNLEKGRNLAVYLAKTFSPLLLMTLFIYLAVVVGVGENPFLDRDFLLSFNGVLLIVLAVIIFSISESERVKNKTISDYINSVLIMLALVIDVVALSAIAFRLSSFGITPNRLAVLGINILIGINLIWIFYSYVRFLKSKKGISTVQNAVTDYLPVYGLWAAIVTFTFPLIFK